jgi:hypothetical protein
VGKSGELEMLNQTGSLVISLFLISATLWVATTGTAHAYIDIGSGSLMIQILLASLFASLFALKVFWLRFTGWMGRILSSIKGQKDPQSPEQ